MASTSTPKSLPAGFQVPFKIVAQATRHDCSLAAVAMLTGKTLDEVWAAAFKLGLPKTGVYFVTDVLIAKLLMQLGGLVSTVWKDFTAFGSMPNVALLWVDTDANDPENTGRTVLFHHVPAAPDKFTSFSYIIDPMPQTETAKQIMADVNKFTPTHYIEVTSPPSAKGNGK